MAVTDPAQAPHSNLALRVVSSAVLAPLALLVAYLGGLPFALFWTVAASIVLWEWARMVNGAHTEGTALAGWFAAGAAYAGIILFAPILLRQDVALGFVAIAFHALRWVAPQGWASSS